MQSAVANLSIYASHFQQFFILPTEGEYFWVDFRGIKNPANCWGIGARRMWDFYSGIA